MIEEIEQRKLVGDGNNEIHLAEIHATRNGFDDATRLCSSGGRPDLAVKMFTELSMFDKAEQWVANDDQRQDLLKMRAGWAGDAGDKQKTVKIFLQLEDYASAFKVMRDLEWRRRILDVARKLDVVAQKELIMSAVE